MMIAKIIVIPLFIFAVVDIAFSNNLSITNVELTHDADGVARVEFDISWNNSWRGSINYDAVWIFLKYKTSAENNWYHGTMSTSDTSCSSGTTLTVDPSTLSDAGTTLLGAFVYRSESGAGSVSSTDCYFLWDYTADSVASTTVIDEIEVFGTEMVFIPEGDYDLGDGDGSLESSYALHTTDNNYASISDALEADIKVDSILNVNDDAVLKAISGNTGVGIDGDAGLDTDNDGDFETPYFPTGYPAFYVMKYEITQGEYVDFLNNLTGTQAGNRWYDTTSNRYTVTEEPYEAGAVDRAMNYMSWMDLAAYCDWAALRPITECEFEKISRGPTTANLYEYAWGTTSVNGAEADEIYPDAAEDGDETISDLDANACYGDITFTTGDGGTGPLRAGIFAESNTKRRNSGASYYGVMDLSGNMAEICVTLGHSEGRDFYGTGDGVLHSTGNSDEATWPDYNGKAGYIDDGDGSGKRGGNWYNNSSYLRVSDRSYMATAAANNAVTGGRCARNVAGY